MFNWFLQLFCADSIFVKHFWHWIAINVQTMWTTELVVSLLPRWWPYEPWASDDCKQRLFCRNIQNLAHCRSRRSQIELLLHHLSKGNEPLLLTETVLTGSLCSWIYTCPQHRSDCCPERDHQCSHWSETCNSNLWLTKYWGFSRHITWVIFLIFFGGGEQMHLVSVRTASNLPRLLLRGNVSRSPLKGLLINWKSS